MKSKLLIIVFCLIIPVLTVAQTANATKEWGSFFEQFKSAVNKKDRDGLKRLMASEKDFFSGGTGDSRDEWLANVSWKDGNRYKKALKRKAMNGNRAE